MLRNNVFFFFNSTVLHLSLSFEEGNSLGLSLLFVCRHSFQSAVVERKRWHIILSGILRPIAIFNVFGYWMNQSVSWMNSLYKAVYCSATLMNRTLRKRLSCFNRDRAAPAIARDWDVDYHKGIYFANRDPFLRSRVEGALHYAWVIEPTDSIVQDFTDTSLFLATFAACATCGSNDERLTVLKFAAGMTDPCTVIWVWRT